MPVKRVYTGIEFDDPKTLLGLVSEYEEREVAMASGYPWNNWMELSSDERAVAIAHQRMRNLISLHVSDAVSRYRE